MNTNPVETQPSEEADIVKKREDGLLLRWSKGGRLNKSEMEEIRHRLPASSSSCADGQPIATESGNLKRARYAKDLVDYEPLFSSKIRALKRWIAVGKAASPPELPPLDRPEQMAAWWSRHMRRRVPMKLIVIAEKARAAETGAETSSINANDYPGAMGDAVNQARSYVAVTNKQLADAYLSGFDARISICQQRWLKSIEALRRAEAGAREEAKDSGNLLNKAEAVAELAQFLEILRHMRATMAQRIRRRLESFRDKLGQVAPDFVGMFDADCEAAIEKERKSEDAVFQNLKQFESVAEIDSFQQLKT